MLWKAFFYRFVPAYGCTTLLFSHLLCGIGIISASVFWCVKAVLACLKIALRLLDCRL